MRKGQRLPKLRLEVEQQPEKTALVPEAGIEPNAFNPLEVREHLQAVAKNALVWRWANLFMGTAAVVLQAGLSMLTTILEGANERVFSRLGLVGFLLAAGWWVIFSTFRAVVTVWAAQQMAATGTVPTSYEPPAKFGFALFYVSAIVGFLALAAYGGSLLQVGLLPA